MTFEEWKESAKRVHLDDSELSSHIFDAFEGGVPGEEIYLFGEEQSWIVISEKDGKDFFHIVTGRWDGDADNFEEAARLLWENHAQYEQESPTFPSP
jgi:hypothetical protein